MPDAAELWQAYSEGLGAYGARLRRTDQADRQLAEAQRHGWTMGQLAHHCTADLPANPRSVTGIVWARLSILCTVPPPSGTPAPPRWQSLDTSGQAMPEDVKASLRREHWWRR